MSAPSLTEREIRSLPEIELYRYAATVWPDFRLVADAKPNNKMRYGARATVNGKVLELITEVTRGNRVEESQAETATLHGVRESLIKYLKGN